MTNPVIVKRYPEGGMMNFHSVLGIFPEAEAGHLSKMLMQPFFMLLFIELITEDLRLLGRQLVV